MSIWLGISGSFHSGSDFGTVSAAGAGSMTLDAAFLSAVGTMFMSVCFVVLMQDSVFMVEIQQGALRN